MSVILEVYMGREENEKTMNKKFLLKEGPKKKEWPHI